MNPFDTSNSRNLLHDQESRIPSLFERHHQQPQLESIREEPSSRFDLSQTIQDLMSNVGNNKSFASLFSNQNSNDTMSNGISENSSRCCGKIFKTIIEYLFDLNCQWTAQRNASESENLDGVELKRTRHSYRACPQFCPQRWIRHSKKPT